VERDLFSAAPATFGIQPATYAGRGASASRTVMLDPS